jgi:uncharacterized protein YndB with AHSA1/START domain
MILQWTLVTIAVLIVLFIAIVALRPAEFRVERSTTVRAPAAAVFGQVNDLQNWRAWSPWEKLDPALKRTYEGPPAGTGAVYAWQGNKDVGAGRMTIVESRPGELVRMRLEFYKPFAATNDVHFRFAPERDGTAVTWSMTGQNNFFAKAIALVINMDRMVGGMFEQGLSQMKAVVEKK